MNAISYALNFITGQIPKEILQKTFISNISHTTRLPVSVETRIRELVINARVLPDVNIIGGLQVTIPLDGLPKEMVDPSTYVVRIPKTLTQGRSITSVTSVAVAGTVAGVEIQSPYAQGGDLLQAYQAMLQAVASIPYVSEARAWLIGENVVMIQGSQVGQGGLFLRCELENDANLTHIKKRSYNNFAKLCLLATKSHIYTTNAIPMDIAFIEGGASLSVFKEIVDSYSDAEEEYQEFLKTTWAKTAKLNDPEIRERLIRITTGGLY